MQTNIFDDLSLLLPYLSDLEEKINNLQKIRKTLTEQKFETEICLCLTEFHKYLQITQKHLPFNLNQEMLIIIDDSIDEMQKQYSNLSQYKHQLDK
jgi:hypothetical protein